MPAKPRAALRLPTGTVTFLFTDIEGSTKLWEAQPDLMRTALARHDALMRKAIFGANGYVFKTVGDAFCAAFAMASDAVSAVLAAQLAIVAEPWPKETPIKVRMALHTGAVETSDDDYFGQPVNRVARLLSTGHGGQTILSQTTYDLVRDSLPAKTRLLTMGDHRLKDLGRPESVFQLLHPELPSDFPPLRSLDNPELKHNLPPQVTSFVGREKEMAEIRAQLGKTRLLTVSGSGGSGKTRLCLQVAADSLEQFPDGIWFVELAALADPSLVAQAVATVLSIMEEPGKPITRTLTEYLKHKQLLLLLDNCEHLLDVCAKLADTLLRQCPSVRVLASSREALGIAGEQTYRLPSLSLPNRKEVQTPQTLSTYDSVQLFIDRALLVRPDFQVTNQNAPAVASLCHHLDGIPLAIELAAARVRSLAVEEIDRKLDQRFRLLTGGSRTALPRQQTLRSLIDWSYDLLHEPEKLLLQRLSVFAGGCTLAAAEQVCAADGADTEGILDLLTSLSDKNLVGAEEMGGRSRYRLLETMRQYARDRLVESGGGEAVRGRHRDYFLALAEEAEPQLFGAQQAVWLQRLEEEHENLRAALDWSLAAVGAKEGLRLCGALQRFWITRGHLSEGREWCVRVLEKAGAEERTPEHGKALHAAGVMAYFQRDYPAARAQSEKSLAIRRGLKDRLGVASSLSNLAAVADVQGDRPGAQALLEESLVILRQLGDRIGIAGTLNNLGNDAISQGDFVSARALHEESLAVMRELGHRFGIANSLNNLGYVAFEQGDYSAARAWHEKSLAIRRELGNRSGIANSLVGLGAVAHAEGDHSAARALHQEGLVIQCELGDRLGIAASLEELAAAVSALVDPLRAARIWGAADRLRAEIGSPLSPNERLCYDRRIAAARAALSDGTAFDRAWQEGRALTREQTIELALEETVP